MFSRFTEKARQIMDAANQKAKDLGHEYVGTEHILLAIACDDSCCNVFN